MHFRISSFLSFQRKTKRHVFLLLFVLTPVHLNWPSYAIGKCYRSPRQLISTMKHWWLYITIHSFTIFKWKMRNLRLNLIYLSFFVQYIYLHYKVRKECCFIYDYSHYQPHICISIRLLLSLFNTRSIALWSKIFILDGNENLNAIY